MNNVSGLLKYRSCRFGSVFFVTRSLVTLFLFLVSIGVNAYTEIDLTYDELNRLIYIVRDTGPEITYTYDVVGNRETEVITNSPDSDADLTADFADPDDDNDGMPDYYENQYGLNPLDASDASLDPDNDTRDNLQEFLEQSNPLTADVATIGGQEEISIPVLPAWAMIGLSILLVGFFWIRKNKSPALPIATIMVGLLTFASISEALAEPVADGWFDGFTQLVHPDDAKKILNINTDKFTISAPSSFQEPVSGIENTLAVSTASTLISASNEFSQLARALENDPIKIYEFVLNNIDYTPYYGYLKGAHLTYIERSGNDFDQSALLVELLRAAGYTANYRNGSMFIPIDNTSGYDMASWLGVAPSLSVISSVVSSAGIPGSAGSSYLIERVWVEANINGQTVKLDPAFKRYESTNGVDLATAMQYTQPAFLSAVQGTMGTDYVQNLNQAGLSSELLRLSNNLNSYMNLDYANYTIEELIGGRRIIPENVTVLPTALRFLTSGGVLWAEIPSQYHHTLQIQHGGIDVTLPIHTIAGKNISLSYSSSAGSASFSSGIEENINESNEQVLVSNTTITEDDLAPVKLPPPISEEVSESAVTASAINTINLGTFEFENLPSFFTFLPPYTNTNSGPNSRLRHVGTYSGNGSLSIFPGIGTNILVSGGSQLYGITVQRTSAGTKTGTYTRTIDCLDTFCFPQTNVYNLRATLVASPANFTGSSGANFGSTTVRTLVERDVIVRNSGALPLTIKSVFLSGGNIGLFQIVSGSGNGTVASNSTRLIRVRYLADEVGSHSSNIQINYDYGGNFNLGVNLPLFGETLIPFAQLFLDDTLIASESVIPANIASRNDVVVTVNHPYAGNSGSFADQASTYKVEREARGYVLVSGFGEDKRSELLSRAQRKLDNLLSQDIPTTDHRVLSASLNVMGQTWLQQSTLNDKLLATLSNTLRIRHHRFGLVGQERGFFIDVKTQFGSSIGRDGSSGSDLFRASAFLSSALEHGVLEQLQFGVSSAASTIKILTLANAQSTRIYDVDSSNFSVIRPLLTNYSTATLDGFDAAVTDEGARFILPQNGAIILNQWSGKGYVDYRIHPTTNASSIGMIIGGDYFGGFASTQGLLDSNALNAESLSERQPDTSTHAPVGADPVNLVTGAYIENKTDIALGRSGVRGLSLTRYYNSQQANQNTAKLGQGWTHNNNIYARKHSATEAAMGLRAPRDMLPILVASFVTLDLMANSQPTLSQWAASALTADWAMDKILNNAVSVTMGTDVVTFIKQPNGNFSPPEGVTATLTGSAGNYLLTERFGTVLDFNVNDRVGTVSDIDGNVKTYTYSGDNLTRVTDSFGRQLNFNYSGNLLSGVSDSAGRSISYGHVGNQLRTVTGLENAIWQYSYDSNNQIVTVTNPVNTQIVSNTYDDLGRVVQQVLPREVGTATYRMHYTGESSSEETPDGARTTYFYNKGKRTVAVKNAIGHINATSYDGQGHAVNYADAMGNTSSLVYDSKQNLVQSIDAMGHASTFVYDQMFRMKEAINAKNYKRTSEFDNEHHLTITSDQRDNFISYTYRPDGLVATRRDSKAETLYAYDSFGFIATSKIGSQPVVATNYDTIGRMLSLTDQAGATTNYTYDDRGLVKTKTDPLGKTVTSNYNSLGQLINETDRNGDVTTATYTPTTKLDIVTYPNRPATTLRPAVSGFSIDFNYDIDRDRLINMVDQHGTTTNTYDTIDRLTSHTDSNGHTVQYAYDGVNNVTQLTYPDGKTVSYTYDELNRVAGITIDWLNKTAITNYDEISRLTAINHFNGTSTHYDYDSADRLFEINHKKSTGQSFLQYAYQRDQMGNTTEVRVFNEPIEPERLINASYSQTFNAKKNRLLSAETNEPVDFTYDDEGQTETKEGVITQTSYVFDSAYRLVEFATADHNVSYQYDGVGNRLSATRQGVTTQYIHDAGGNLIAEANAAGTITRYYIHGLGLMAFVDAQTNQLYVYHHDETGHTVAVTNSIGKIVNRYAYSPYGKLLGQEEMIDQPFTYAGQAGVYTEAEGLYYMRARYYDADLGRFINEDPAGFAGGLNLYAYAGGNPISFIDPSGLGPQGGGLGAAALEFGLGFIPGYDLYIAITDPNATGFDLAIAAVGVFPGAGKAVNVLGKAAKWAKPLKNQASDLIFKNANRNRVTLRSPSQKMEVDLAGKSHGGIPTPHTKVSPRNLNAPNQPAFNTKNSPVRPATQQDIRTVRRFLERQE